MAIETLEVDESEYNGIMIVAALIATITFAAMVMPPGGVVPPSSSSAIVLSNGTQVSDVTAGHAVMSLSSTGHYNLGTAMAAFLYLSFTLSFCCLLLSLAVVGVHDSRKTKRYCCLWSRCVGDWRATFVLSYVTLILAIMFAYAAFVCAAWMTFNEHVPGIKALTGVATTVLMLAVFWLLCGPFSILRCCNRRYDTDIAEKPGTRC